MPKRRDPEKLEMIQRATTKLVVKTGFTGLKMAEVASEAGLATGTVYIYYKSKEVLVNEVFMKTRKEIADLLQNPNLQRDTFYETFEAIWLTYFHFCHQQQDKIQFIEQFRYSGMIWANNLQVSDGYFEKYDQFLLKGQKQGFLRRMELGTMKAQLRGACHEIVKQLRKDRVRLSDSLLDLCFDMAWNSVRK